MPVPGHGEESGTIDAGGAPVDRNRRVSEEQAEVMRVAGSRHGACMAPRVASGGLAKAVVRPAHRATSDEDGAGADEEAAGWNVTRVVAVREIRLPDRSGLQDPGGSCSRRWLSSMAQEVA
ncbi:hypothetical protein GCM10010306_092500 [Streptomyces umbrinus]|nr:hypothetical protein GCM10010306_092500 [Streptomyces umbrinus]